MNNQSEIFTKLDLSNLDWAVLNALSDNNDIKGWCEYTGMELDCLGDDSNLDVVYGILSQEEDIYLDKMESELIDSQDLVFRGTYERANM
jgi:hypothetical protein